jgi:hypothetical protein
MPKARPNTPLITSNAKAAEESAEQSSNNKRSYSPSFSKFFDDTEVIAAWALFLSVAMAFVCVIVFLYGQTVSGSDGQPSPNSNRYLGPWLYRAAEFFGSVSGAILIFILLLRINNPVTSVLGMVFIAALIIPTQELIKLTYLIRSEDKQMSESLLRNRSLNLVNVPDSARPSKDSPLTDDGTRRQNIQEYIVNSPTPTTTLAPAFLLQMKLLGYEIIHPSRNPLNSNIEFPTIDSQLAHGQSRESIERQISAIKEHSFVQFLDYFNYAFHLQRMITNLQQRDMIQTVINLSNPEARRNTIALHRNDRRFYEDMEFLRISGLVHWPYENFQQIELTFMGLDIAKQVDPNRRSTQRAATPYPAWLPERLSAPILPTVSRQFSLPQNLESIPEIPLNEAVQLNISQAPQFRKLTLSQSMTLEITLRSQNGDSYLNLQTDQGTIIAVDDDSGGSDLGRLSNYDAKITQNLASGTYIIGATEVFGQNQLATLRVSGR